MPSTQSLSPPITVPRWVQSLTSPRQMKSPASSPPARASSHEPIENPNPSPRVRERSRSIRRELGRDNPLRSGPSRSGSFSRNRAHVNNADITIDDLVDMQRRSRTPSTRRRAARSSSNRAEDRSVPHQHGGSSDHRDLGGDFEASATYAPGHDQNDFDAVVRARPKSIAATLSQYLINIWITAFWTLADILVIIPLFLLPVCVVWSGGRYIEIAGYGFGEPLFQKVFFAMFLFYYSVLYLHYSAIRDFAARLLKLLFTGIAILVLVPPTVFVVWITGSAIGLWT